MEIMEDRYARKSIIITSQYPPDKWWTLREYKSGNNITPLREMLIFIQRKKTRKVQKGGILYLSALFFSSKILPLPCEN